MQAVTEITFQWSPSDNLGWSWFRAYELCGPAPREAVLSILVPDPNYVWWIDELMRSPLPTGGVIAHRLYEYGPFETADYAEKMIEQLKQQPRFRQSDLRVGADKRRTRE